MKHEVKSEVTDTQTEQSSEQAKVELPEFKTYNSAKEELEALELAIKKATLADLEAQREERELQRQEREYNLQDLKQRLNERAVKDLQKKEDRANQGRALAQQHDQDDRRQKQCTHKKGGTVSPRDMTVLSTGGDSTKYAVVKHQMINGDIWIRCLRCAKTWVPPVKENFYFDAEGKVKLPAVGPQAGIFDAAKFEAAKEDYLKAVAFPTNNTMSSSVQCRFMRWNDTIKRWVDAGEEYSQAMKSTNLR